MSRGLSATHCVDFTVVNTKQMSYFYTLNQLKHNNISRQLSQHHVIESIK